MRWRCSGNLRKVAAISEPDSLMGKPQVGTVERSIRIWAAESGVSLEPEPPLPQQCVPEVPSHSRSLLDRLFRREPSVTGMALILKSTAS